MSTDTAVGGTAHTEGTLPFLKGHGTENDFVVLPDDDAAVDLTPALVRGLCDRRSGLGADGVLRISRASALLARGVLDALPEGVAPDDWFMDYRNADGTTAEMCGNGVRVFAHALVDTGRAGAGTVRVGTRSGPRPADVRPGDAADGSEAVVGVDMGEPRVLGVTTVRLGGRRVAGLGVDVGNPHVACVVPGLDAVALAALPVGEPPEFDHEFFPHGVNVEIATEPADGRVHMRVHERGAGETHSCGTGIVATAVAALADGGATDGEIDVVVPGGTVHVELRDGRARMTGPSRLVARGRVLPVTR